MNHWVLQKPKKMSYESVINTGKSSQLSRAIVALKRNEIKQMDNRHCSRGRRGKTGAP